MVFFVQNKPTFKHFNDESDSTEKINVSYTQDASRSNIDKSSPCSESSSNQSIPRMELSTNSRSYWLDEARVRFSGTMKSVIEWLWSNIELSNDSNSEVFSRRAVVIFGVDPICHAYNVSPYFSYSYLKFSLIRSEENSSCQCQIGTTLILIGYGQDQHGERWDGATQKYGMAPPRGSNPFLYHFDRKGNPLLFVYLHYKVTYSLIGRPHFFATFT